MAAYPSPAPNDPYSSLRERLMRAAGNPLDDRRAPELAARGIAEIETLLRKHAAFEAYYAARARRPTRVRHSTT